MSLIEDEIEKVIEEIANSSTVYLNSSFKGLYNKQGFNADKTDLFSFKQIVKKFSLISYSFRQQKYIVLPVPNAKAKIEKELKCALLKWIENAMLESKQSPNPKLSKLYRWYQGIDSINNDIYTVYGYMQSSTDRYLKFYREHAPPTEIEIKHRNNTLLLLEYIMLKGS